MLVGNKVIVKSVGTVDYLKGEIILNTINITETVATNEIIEVLGQGHTYSTSESENQNNITGGIELHTHNATNATLDDSH